MTTHVPEWFIRQLASLAAIYPSWKPTEETYRFFWAALNDIDEVQMQRAVVAHMRKSRFHPTPADLIEHTKEIPNGGASEAWDEMRRHRTRYSQTRYNAAPYQPEWSSEAVRRAAEAVNWRDPDWQTEQIPTIRAQFERYYNAIVSQQAVADLRSDVENVLPGFRRTLGIGPGDEPRKLID